ncbi:MAG: SMP-30/gluconolactonase/LRE family protein [Bryobacteraceae bacterium]|nr:SMP-30/gluconolactonase/LRE family protein [Bryobacteraceae bacterium]
MKIPQSVLLLAAIIGAVSCNQPAPVPKAELTEPPGPEATIATAVSFTEGPTVDADGNVYFTETISARIMKFAPQSRKLTVFRENSNRANGLLFDDQGRLIACEGSDAVRNEPRVTRTDMKTGKVEVLASSYEGKKFNSPNDVTIDSKGRLYFTDPVPDATAPAASSSAGKTGTPGVYRIDPDGKITRLLAGPDIEWPNGVTISPDDRTFYLIEAHKIEGGTRGIRAYDLAADGTLSNMRIHYNFYPGRSADGMTIDTQGNIYAAAGLHRRRGTHETLDTRTGIHVISPQGKRIGFTPIPEDTITNCAFGGPDNRTLYVTAGKTLFQIRYDIAGTRK